MSELERTIPEVMIDAAEQYAGLPALVEGDVVLSYSDLLDRALRAGAVLASMGIGKGDRVGIWLPNSSAWVEAALGVLFIGAVVVPLNTRLKAQEAAYILRKSRARIVVAAGQFLGVDYTEIVKSVDLPHLLRCIRALPGAGQSDEWQDALTAATQSECELVLQAGKQVRRDDLAEIMFTSGTTGFPKGAMLHHGQIIRTYSIWATSTAVRRGDRYMIIAPMFHSFGFKAGVLASILKGAAMYPVKTFDVPAVLKAIEAERITTMGGPPTIFISLLELNRSAKRDISSLRSISTGGGMVPPHMIRALQGDVGVEVVCNAYGLTESCALATVTRQGDDAEHIAVSAGSPLEGVEIRCVGPDGNEVPTGEAGEVQVRGFNVMSGYFDDPAGTEAVMTADGWLRTGDVGIIDQRGCLRITDRIKDMFIVGGFNCYPAEIEKIILDYPAVSEVAVIGVADERLGEVCKAFVVPSGGPAFDAEAFIAWCRANMGNYKVPRYVQAMDALPRNALGKVEKFKLRANAS